MNLLSVFGASPYPVLVDSSIKEIPKYLSRAGFNGKILIITDTNVGNLYLKKVTSLLKDKYIFETYLLPPGEINKNQMYLSEIWEILTRKKFHRNDCIISLGGGVISDIAGLAASTFSRGIKLFLIPSTLLSQIDASIGGKNAINFSGTKNIIGTFYSPSAVLIDISLLNSLTPKEISNGMGEVIKYSLIMPTDFFEYLEKSVSENIYQAKAIKYIIWRCTQFKVDIVNRDPYEENIRKILNFGHTFGHAIESFYSYERYSHGESIALGMLMACRLSIYLKRFSRKQYYRVESLLNKFGLPTTLPNDFYPEIAIDYMKNDKKNTHEGITLIIPIMIGKVEEIIITDEKLILNALGSIIE